MGDMGVAALHSRQPVSWMGRRNQPPGLAGQTTALCTDASYCQAAAARFVKVLQREAWGVGLQK